MTAPSMAPPRHELAALADELMADIRHYYGDASLDEKLARALRGDILARLVYVRKEAARNWLGSPIKRCVDDDD
jgi:hypothetical protein